MTDLEITKLCAEAMRFGVDHTDGGMVWAYEGQPHYDLPRFAYDPLHNDAQAMALVKKFCLQINWRGVWPAVGSWEPIHGPDLNRAICEYVAKMQSAK